MITVSINVDSAVTIDVNWFNRTRHISNATNRVSISPLSGKKPLYKSILTIDPLSDVDNSSDFICKSSALSDSMFIEQSGVGQISVTISVQKSWLFYIEMYLLAIRII